MKGKSDFEIMLEMSRKNLDIQMSSNIVELKKVQAGGLLTFAEMERKRY